MDEAVDDEVTAVGAPDGTHILSKEHEYSLKPSNSNIVVSHQLVTPHEGNESATHLFIDILDGKNLDRKVSSEQTSVSPHCMADSSVMVEELTVRNYNGENIAVVGTSNDRDGVQSRQNQCQHFYQKASGAGSASSLGEAANGDKSQITSSVWEDVENFYLPDSLDQNQRTSGESHHDSMDDLPGNGDKSLSSNIFRSGVRTKILSKSGFSEYFVKNTLKGKGIICKGPVHRGFGDGSGSQTYSKSANTGLLVSNAQLSSTLDIAMPITSSLAETWPSMSINPAHDEVILRDWLIAGQNKVSKIENLRIFRQIVKLVDFSHSQGVALQDLRPSCFKLLHLNQVVYLGSSVRTDFSESVSDQDIPWSERDQIDKRPLEQNLLPFDSHFIKKQKFGNNVTYTRRWPHSASGSGFRSAFVNVTKGEGSCGPDSRNLSSENRNPKVESKSQSRSSVPNASDVSRTVFPSESFVLEEKWYPSSEQLSDRRLAFSSNIYSLGVLLFELLSSFDSRRSHEAAMLDLRNRILPPELLSENPKEAGFCLWLLHPEPSSRPTTSTILQSEVICGIQDLAGDELVSSIEKEDAESELMLHFFFTLKEQKQRDASRLAEEIRFIEADIQEVEKRQTKELPIASSLPWESLAAKGIFLHRGHINADFYPKLPPMCDEKLMRNIRQIESAYFSMRSNIQLPERDVTTRGDRELLRLRENWLSGKNGGMCKTTDRVGGFFTDLCKYAHYNKFKARGVLRNGDLANSAKVICSLSFDRDEDYLAAGGVSKKIKIFNFHALFDNSVDIHYPVIEMSNKSKLSCICWNSYIRNYLASTDHDGTVKLWDAATGQNFSEFVEHDERAWSVDFSRLDPIKLASGSDDRLVKLWSINERNSLCTIRNNANVCCVQFSAESTYLLAFSSADCKIYCYDLRNISTPWCILAGHEKAVSYAKFLDAETLVSASTDNTLKIWDLSKTSANGLSRDACILTLRGHTNEKNFVGLSVADGYISCGSETNEHEIQRLEKVSAMAIKPNKSFLRQLKSHSPTRDPCRVMDLFSDFSTKLDTIIRVFAYYRSLPMPITSLKFGSIDPISGKEADDDNGQFVSSVCWRRKSDMVIAANSTGCIKLLEMM